MKLMGLKNTDNLKKMVEVIQDRRLLKDETMFSLKFKEDSEKDSEFYEHQPGMEDDETSRTTLADFFNNFDSAEIIYTGMSSGKGWGSRKSSDIFIGNATNETLEIKLQYKAVNKVSSR